MALVSASESLLQANILPPRHQMLESLKVAMKILFDFHSFTPMTLTALLIQTIPKFICPIQASVHSSHSFFPQLY